LKPDRNLELVDTLNFNDTLKGIVIDEIANISDRIIIIMKDIFILAE
jgi:hypothetical protein